MTSPVAPAHGAAPPASGPASVPPAGRPAATTPPSWAPRPDQGRRSSASSAREDADASRHGAHPLLSHERTLGGLLGTRHCFRYSALGFPLQMSPPVGLGKDFTDNGAEAAAQLAGKSETDSFSFGPCLQDACSRDLLYLTRENIFSLLRWRRHFKNVPTHPRNQKKEMGRTQFESSCRNPPLLRADERQVLSLRTVEKKEV